MQTVMWSGSFASSFNYLLWRFESQGHSVFFCRLAFHCFFAPASFFPRQSLERKEGGGWGGETQLGHKWVTKNLLPIPPLATWSHFCSKLCAVIFWIHINNLMESSKRLVKRLKVANWVPASFIRVFLSLQAASSLNLKISIHSSI